MSSSSVSSSRPATHAGSWYESDSEELSKQLNQWLQQANNGLKNNNNNKNNQPLVRAIICPHAGYSYSGSTAGYSYLHLLPSNFSRIFILGPSHHYYTKSCELASVKQYETPIQNLKLDTKTIEEMKQNKLFQYMKSSTDNEEHSIELQLPYIAQILHNAKVNIPIVPVLVGNLSSESEAIYGEYFSQYLNDPANFFIISSDFCHWGKRFDYQYYDEKDGNISKSIEKLDKLGMKTIESLDPKQFELYEKQYKNTICGRHPISVFLHAVAKSKLKFECKFVHYKQSSECKKPSDSSVSYASGVFTQVS